MKISERISNMTTISAAEIYQEFLKLNDTQKVSVIEKLKKANVDDNTIEGLQWLAALSSDKLKDRVLAELYAEESFKRLKARGVGSRPE